MRWSGEGGRFVVIPVEPGRVFALGLAPAPGRRGEPVQMLPGMRFGSLADAEWAVFKIRWEAITGTKLPDELREP